MGKKLFVRTSIFEQQSTREPQAYDRAGLAIESQPECRSSNFKELSALQHRASPRDARPRGPHEGFLNPPIGSLRQPAGGLASVVDLVTRPKDGDHETVVSSPTCLVCSISDAISPCLAFHLLRRNKRVLPSEASRHLRWGVAHQDLWSCDMPSHPLARRATQPPLRNRGAPHGITEKWPSVATRHVFGADGPPSCHTGGKGRSRRSAPSGSHRQPVLWPATL